MPKGTIIKGIGGFYYVSSEDGGIYECKVRGIFRKSGLTPLTGDSVLFSVTDPLHKKGCIDHIEDRSTLLVRPAVANVNQLVAVIATTSPEPDLLLLDKILVTAEKTGIKAVLCINKTDLDGEYSRSILRDAYTAAGYTVIETNFLQDEGFIELKLLLRNHISVFAGQSGVGKSTLLNRVMNMLVMKTGELSDKIGRGKHTTRHAELTEIEGGGYVVDTPGFSSFELAGVSHTELEYFFHEFGDYRKYCRFKGCSHITEPDCGVKKAVGDNQIDSGRYGRYVDLYALLKHEDKLKYKKGSRKGT